MRKVRLGPVRAESPKVARLVVDLTQTAPYRIIDGADGVRIVFGEGRRAGPAAHAAAPWRRCARRSPSPRAGRGGAARGRWPSSRWPCRPCPSPRPRRPPPEPAAAPEQANIGQACGQTGYLGTPISLDFKDGDLQDIFRLFSDISGLNVVVNPGVSGKVTLKLNEVPWGRALELILKTNGLGCVLEDNVIRIARLTDLQKRGVRPPQARRGEGSSPASSPTTRSASPTPRRTTLSGVLKQAGALSARGQVNVDARTNTIIIRDLPRFVDKAQGPDRRPRHRRPRRWRSRRGSWSPRATSRATSASSGASARRRRRASATRTDQVFPNSIVLNGGAVPATLGHRRPTSWARAASPRRRDRGRGPGLRGQPARERVQQRHRHLDGQHPGQLQPGRRADRPRDARAAGACSRRPKVTTQNNQVGGDQAGRPDPDPDAREQHGQRPVQGRGADPAGHARRSPTRAP